MDSRWLAAIAERYSDRLCLSLTSENAFSRKRFGVSGEDEHGGSESEGPERAGADPDRHTYRN